MCVIIIQINKGVSSMIDKDSDEYIIVWRIAVDKGELKEDCESNLKEGDFGVKSNQKINLVVDVDPDQIIDDLIMNHNDNSAIQFVKDLSVAMESAYFDNAMREYFNEITGELREW